MSSSSGIRRRGFFGAIAAVAAACVARVSARPEPPSKLQYYSGDAGTAYADRSAADIDAITDEMRDVLGRGRIYGSRTVYMTLEQ